MKKIILGMVLSVVLGAMTVIGYKAYQAYKLNQAVAVYLLAPTEVRDRNGKPLSRAELIDLVLADVVRKNPSKK